MHQGRSQHAPLLLHHAPHTPGRSYPPEFLTPQRQPPQAAQLSCFSPQTLLPQGMYNSPTHSQDQHMSACPLPQLSRIGLAGPALSQAEEAWLLRLGAQPMSQECPVSSRQLSAQLPAQQPTQPPVPPLAQPRDPRPLSPILRQASPVSSGQSPMQPPAKAPVQLAKSRDPRRPAHQSPAVTISMAKPVEQLRLSPQIPEPVSPTSPTQSALFASFVMLDSPDATSSVLQVGDALLDTGDALMMASSPARWRSPEPPALTPRLQGPHRSESTLAPLDALLNNHGDFVIADQSDEFGFGMDDSHSVLLSEAIQAAEQHSLQAQRDSVSPPQLRAVSETSEGISQSLALRAPSSSLESQNFSLPKSQTLCRLLQQPESNESFPSASKGHHSSLRRNWPETQPYTICRWWFLVMQ